MVAKRRNQPPHRMPTVRERRVMLRYKEPGQSLNKLVEFPVHKPSQVPTVASTDTDLKFALAVAGWG